jgi:hypothetical protein
MDTRKMYVRPAVESEEILEQTSLACTLAMWPDFPGKPSCGPTLELDCALPLFKGGAFDSDQYCSTLPLISFDCVVQFS